MINEFLEHVVNGSTSLDFFHREDCIEFEDFECNIDNVLIRESEKKVVRSKDSMTVPVIRSQVGSKKNNTLRSNILTFEARNFNADRGVNTTTDDVVSDIIVERFFDTCIDSSKLASVVDEPLMPDMKFLSNWLDSRTPQGLSSLKTDLSAKTDFYDNLTKFSLMVKSDAKPKLDDSVITKIATGQNIVYHKRRLNAYFSNVFQQVFERLNFVVASNVILYNCMNVDEFAAAVQSRVGTDVDKYFCGELDFSKYDKSQGGLFKQVEEKVLQRLGVEPGILDLFYSSEYESSVTTADGSFNADIGAQRRSGGSNTWLGNTIVNMCLQSYCLDFSNFACICFAGDDSLIFSETPLSDVYSDLSTLFGFDLKFINHAVPYFCSKYVVSDGDNLVFVPDPYKVLVKLGRLTSDKEAMCHENFMSFTDAVKHLSSEVVVSKLVYYHAAKYGDSAYAYGAFATIHCLAANFSQFRRLYISKSGKSFGFRLDE